MAQIIGICSVIMLSVALLAAATLLIICAITDYRPKPMEYITELYSPILPSTRASATSPGAESAHPDRPCLHHGQGIPDQLHILSWNIGYGGLGDNMDFFYDGGTRVRDTEERTKENLTNIIATIREQNADIVLLQEVDMNSKRSYRIDQCAMLHEAMPEYYIYFAYNYRSSFVPIPVKEPMGKVAGGLVILSKYRPKQVIRHQYPSKFPFPVSMFNLKRCLLTAHFTLADGRELIIGNTHNTAYDTGNMRSLENEYIAKMTEEYRNAGSEVIIGGDWNQYPVEYSPAPEEFENENFSTVQLEEEKFTPFGRIEYARGEKTLRHLDRIYDSLSVLTVTDYFFLTDNLPSSAATMLPMHFRHSDHNPVTITIYPASK